MKAKKIVLPILILICMFIIFLFSNQNGVKSQSLSDEVAIKTLEIKSEITKKEMNQTEKENFVKNTRTSIRKCAHFTIYFLLGILVYQTLKSYNIKKAVLFSILFCFLYACTDEIHQLFIEKRTAQVLDVFIDTSGACAGIGLFYLFTRKSLNVKN